MMTINTTLNNTGALHDKRFKWSLTRIDEYVMQARRLEGSSYGLMKPRIYPRSIESRREFGN
jgi:hypothetical protein